MRTVTQLALASALAAWACTGPPRIPPRPLPTPVPSAIPPPAELHTLHLGPDTLHYELTQSADIRPESAADTSYTRIETRALLSVTITLLPDSAYERSAYELIVSADSLSITAAGSVPLRNQSLPVSVGPLLRVTARIAGAETQVLLPDSLCAHAHLVAAAHEIILSALPMDLTIQTNQRWADSVVFITCTAGTAVRAFSIHEIQDTGRNQPAEFTIRTTTTLDGKGTLRADTVIVTGSVRAQGRALMSGNSRLPILTETQSEGRISVRLGDSTAVFRQIATRQIHQQLPD